MAWLTFLFHTSLVVQVTANLVVLSYVLPAFKRTRHRAFLLISVAFMIGTFDTVCDHTIGLDSMPHAQYVVYRTLRRLTYFSTIVLGAMGLVLLTRSYLQLAEALLPRATADGPQD